MDLSSSPSSPLSSVASRSPSPPADYPSPSSINLSDNGVSSETRGANENVTDLDGPPPAKKRKIAEPKRRTTEYLDLRTLHDSPDDVRNKKQEEELKRLTKALRRKRKIVIVAGAGISVSAGSKSMAILSP